jgi:UPF0755 protein
VSTRARTPDGREAPRRERRWRQGPGGRRTRTLAAGLIGGVVAALLAWFLIALFQPFAGPDRGALRVVVPKGSGVGDIADLLERRGVVSSSFFFRVRATLAGKGGELKPGLYRLKRDMSYGAALDSLVAGPRPEILTLTIPEGVSRPEVKSLIGGSLPGDYLAATRSSSLLDPRRYGAEGAQSLEGFLFPATYQLKRGSSLGRLVEQQLRAFKRKFRQVDLRYARSKNLTPYDVLTIASMIEREARLPRERRLIASVIYNRLHRHMPLGIDATIRFATGNWNRPLTTSALASRSRYNTRRRVGLPPGPIGNPGLASIEAAAKPAHSAFIYFVVKPGTCGEHDFSLTAAKHQRKVLRYERERARGGGRSPAKC